MAIGRSILGIQAADVLRLFEILEKEKDINQVNAVAKGKLAPVLLHAAAFEGSMADIALIKPFLSYESMVKNEFYTPELVYSIVPGALLKYDLPDLAATLAPRKLLMTGIVNSQGNKIQGESLKQKFSIIYDSYQDKGALNNLKVNSVNSENPTDLLTQFFTQ